MPKVKAVLHALGYTSKTLAADIGVSEFKAKRILSEDGIISCSEFYEICRVLDFNLNVMLGLSELGTLRKGGDTV